MRCRFVVQGPEMQRALQNAVDVDLTRLYFMTSAMTTLFDVPNCRITRCGYTGEDGVEVPLSGPICIQIIIPGLPVCCVFRTVLIIL